MKKSFKMPTESSNQRVFLIPDDCVLNAGDGNNVTHSLVKLRHPKTDDGAIFCFTDTNVYEITNYTEKYRSWLIGATVERDGSLLLQTPVDPNFLILPYLIQNTANKYMQLDQLIEDESYSDSRRLSNLPLPDIECIANVKGTSDLIVYQYNENKTLSWLQVKVERLVEFLKSRDLNVGRGAHSANFVQARKKAEYSEDDYVKYAYGIVCDYLPSTLCESLQQHLGLEFPVEKSPIEPPIKKSKTGNGCGPTDDYSKNVKAEKKEKGGKMTAAQKKLQAVDKAGMKSMSSFFSVKQKT